MKRTTTLIAAGLMLAVAAPVFADEAAANKAGCMACHAKDKKLVGPSFKDIAAKHKGEDAGTVAKLMEKVRKGGSGVWGPIPMPPNPESKINDADMKSVVEWILKSA